MELAFAGLHQLCAPMAGYLDRIPVPQRDALRIAFGLAAGPSPDRFLVGLAVLSLLSEVAGDQPLICLVDDEQWLDQASEQTLGFVARRLAAEAVALVFSARDPGAELAGVPELVSCCNWRRPIRPATGRWSGGRLGGWASVSRRAGRRWRRDWSSSQAGCGSGIRWPVRRPTALRHWPSGSSCTRRWPR